MDVPETSTPGDVESACNISHVSFANEANLAVTEFDNLCDSVGQDSITRDGDNLPSLTLFAGEVVSQQRSQKVELENLHQTLLAIRRSITESKKRYHTLSSERILWEQKISILKDEGIQSKSQIDVMKSEILQLIKAKQNLEDLVRDAVSQRNSISCENSAGVDRMEIIREKRMQRESMEESANITRKRAELRDIKNKIADLQCINDSSPTAFVDLRNDCSDMENDKKRLLEILSDKLRLVDAEQNLISKKRVDEESARKRLAAQKLRFTKRIEKEVTVCEELRINFDRLQRQIGDTGFH